MFIDAHAHLNDEKFTDIDAVVARAREAGVVAIVQNGTNATTCAQSIELAKRYDIVKPALGAYPSEGRDADAVIELIRKHSQDIVAIGEVGLDGTYPDMAAQQELFSKMIALAHELGKPLSVHTRKAEKLVLDQLEAAGAKKVHLHCFMGDMQLVRRAIKLGYHFSIPCNIARSEQFQALAREIPSSLLLTETDAPYLAAEKGAMSEPAHIPASVRLIAQLKGMDERELRTIIYQNYQRLFGA